MVDAVKALGQPPTNVQPQHLRLDICPRDGFALVSAKRTGIGAHRGLEILDRLGVPRDIAQLARFPFVADDRHRDAPPLTRLADHVLGRDARAIEQHLAELRRDAVDHPQWPLLDAGLVHREREGRQAFVLRHVAIGAREQEAPVGNVGVAGPHLVPVDHVVIAVACGRRAQ